MKIIEEHRIAEHLARLMAVICVHNSHLEDLHAGRVPVSRTGDGSDIIVQDSEGKRIPLPEVARIDDDEMREIVNRLFTCHLRIDDPLFRAEIERWAAATAHWDAPNPECDPLRHSGGHAWGRVTGPVLTLRFHQPHHAPHNSPDSLEVRRECVND